MSRNIVPRANKDADLGTPEKNWNRVYADTVIADNVQAGNLGAVEQSANNEAVLRDIITHAGSNPVSITIYNDITITTTDLTIPSNVHLNFKDNGRLSPTNGITLTINGSLNAGLQQIFGGEGVITGNPKINAIYPEWFGAVGDGQTDDRIAIQKAMDFADNYVAPLILTKKTYALGSGIGDDYKYSLYVNDNGLTIIGNSYSGFKVTNDIVDYDFICSRYNNDILIDGIYFEGNGNEIDIHRHVFYGVNVSNVTINNCTVKNWDGWVFSFDGDGDNENVYITNNKIINCCRATGIWVGQLTNNVIVKNNIVIGNKNEEGSIDDRILVAYHNRSGSDKVSQNIIVSNNICKYTEAAGIKVAGNNVLVDGNLISDCRMGIMTLHEIMPPDYFDQYYIDPGKNITISNNTIINCYKGSTTNQEGIILLSPNEVKVVNNMISVQDNATYGFRNAILSIDSNNLYINNNNIDGGNDFNIEKGIWISRNSINVNITNNTIRQIKEQGIVIELLSGDVSKHISIINNYIKEVGKVGYSGVVRIIAVYNVPGTDAEALVISDNILDDPRRTYKPIGAFSDYFIYNPQIFRDDLSYFSSDGKTRFHFDNGTDTVNSLALRHRDGGIYYINYMPNYGTWIQGQILQRWGDSTIKCCTASGGLYKETWSSSGNYIKFDWVKGSDNKIYMAVADGGQVQDPVTDTNNTYWVLKANQEATFGTISIT